MHKEEAKINCTIFQRQEPIIKELTVKLNEAKDPQRKIELSSELLREVAVILTCSEYNANRLDCENCQLISKLRNKTIKLIIKTKKLA